MFESSTNSTQRINIFEVAVLAVQMENVHRYLVIFYLNMFELLIFHPNNCKNGHFPGLELVFFRHLILCGLLSHVVDRHPNNMFVFFILVKFNEETSNRIYEIGT